MICTLGIRHFVNKRWIAVEALWSLLIFACFGMFNGEDFMVKNNPLYLSGMSSDGYAGWLKSYKWAREVLENNVEDSIYSYF